MAHIVISGYMIRMPLAGNVLAFAQYLLGFERLGHSVTYVEESGWPQACYDPQSLCYSDDPRPGITAVRALLTAIGSSSELVYVDTANKRTFGMEQLQINECILN